MAEEQILFAFHSVITSSFYEFLKILRMCEKCLRFLVWIGDSCCYFMGFNFIFLKSFPSNSISIKFEWMFVKHFSFNYLLNGLRRQHVTSHNCTPMELLKFVLYHNLALVWMLSKGTISLTSWVCMMVNFVEVKT